MKSNQRYIVIYFLKVLPDSKNNMKYFIFLKRYLSGHIFIPGCALYPISNIECPDMEHVFDEKFLNRSFINQIFIHFQGATF